MPVVSFVDYFSVVKIYAVIICPRMISNIRTNFVVLYVPLVFLSPSVESSASFANLAPGVQGVQRERNLGVQVHPL